LGLFGLIMGWLGKKWGFNGTLLILAPLSFTLLEILRAHGPLGNGFSALYQSLYRFPELIQVVAFAGPWALSAAIVFVNTSVYLALRKRPVYLLTGLGMIGFLAGLFLLPIPQVGEPLKIAVISSNVSQEVKLNGRNLLPLLEKYITLGRQAAVEKPDLIVFPESILPGYILRDERLLPEFTRLAQEAGSHVLFGTGDLLRGEIYNSVALISPTGEILDIYSMVNPVPFGEYIPGRRLLTKIGLGSFAASFLPQDLARGEGLIPIKGIGTPICFESTFPAITRGFAANGATLLATVTNDAWFVGSSELKAHFACAVFRAVENRRFLIQAANGGVSGIVSPRGQILKTVIGEGILFGDVVRQQDQSLYTRWGNGLLYAVLSISGLTAAAWRIKKRWELAAKK
jgi:apolipoprotein N-acyltransferase